MVCWKSAVQLASPLRYFSTSAAGDAVAALAGVADTAAAAERAASNIRVAALMIMLPSFVGWRCAVDLAAAIGLQWAHQARRLHGLDQARRAVVADLEAALHAGDGCLARLGDDAHRFVVQGIGFGIGGAASPPPFAGRETRDCVARALQHLVAVGRRGGGG